MPSPFPGMDPFLEGSLWTTVHFALGAEMVRELAPQIRPRYIDLLRQGQRVPMQQLLPATPYVVLLSRAEQRPITEVWPINLDQALPTILVPLLPGDPDVTLNLQRSLNNVYDMIGYDLIIDYAQVPDIPLAHTEATWVDSQLRIAGHR